MKVRISDQPREVAHRRFTYRNDKYHLTYERLDPRYRGGWSLRQEPLRGRALRRALAGKRLVHIPENDFGPPASEAKPHKMVYVSAYHTQRCYGGPEEGGWWYDAGELLETVRVRRDRVDAVVARMQKQYGGYDDGRPLSSVLSTGNLHISIDWRMGASWPNERPYYC